MTRGNSVRAPIVQCRQLLAEIRGDVRALVRCDASISGVRLGEVLEGDGRSCASRSHPRRWSRAHIQTESGQVRGAARSAVDYLHSRAVQ